MLKYVEITDQSGRQSSIEIGTSKLIIVGALPHCSEVRPKTIDDAIDLRNWLDRYIADNMPEYVDSILQD